MPLSNEIGEIYIQVLGLEKISPQSNIQAFNLALQRLKNSTD